MQLKIGILGGGWLGSKLAQKGVENNHIIKVSTTTPQKVASLQNNGCTAHILTVREDSIEGDFTFFSDVDVLMITIPPGLRKNPDRNYVGMIEQVIAKAVAFKIKKVMYTSSTSVYGFQKNTITEESPTLPETVSAKQIVACENKLLSNLAFESCIIRLGGLIGPDRHPVFTLSGRQNIPNPNSPINFIHQKDAVGAMLHLALNWRGNEIFNAVAPYHPTRKEYYTQMAKLANVTPPSFEERGQIRGAISNSKLLKSANYNFFVENLLILS